MRDFTTWQVIDSLWWLCFLTHTCTSLVRNREKIQVNSPSKYLPLATMLITPRPTQQFTLTWSAMGGQHKCAVNSLRPRQNRRHFADDIFKYIFMNDNVWILIKISLKFVPKGPINNILTLVQVMALRRPGDKPLSEPRMVSLPTASMG